MQLAVNALLKKGLSLPEIVRIVPDRMAWSVLVNNNSQWSNSYDRGAHNFHFRKSVETDSQQKQSSIVKVQEEINFR